MATTKKEINKKGVIWNKQYNTKTNKKYPKVTNNKENEFEQRMVYNSTIIRDIRNNISKSY